jgi:hypothetical protein
MVQALIREDPDDRLNRWLLLDQIVLVGNTPAAMTAASLARETRPDDPVRVPTLARVVLLNRDPRDGSEALGLLRPIARTGESEPRRQALRMMADLEGLEICRWLRGQGLAEEAPLRPAGMVATNQPRALAWIELLGDLRRWNELERFGTEGSPQLDPPSADCPVALAATGRGDMESAVRRLEAAANRSARRPDQLLQSAVLAGQIGRTDTAVLVWLSALRQAGLEAVARPRLLRLIRNRQATGIGKAVENVEMESAVSVALARVFRAEPVVQAQLAYLDSLLRESFPETLRRLGPPSTDNPEVFPFRAIHALAELRMGRNEEALGRLEAARVDWSLQDPRWRAVHAAVLRANPLQHRARRAVAGLAAAQLRPLELALLGDLPAFPAR